MTSPFVAQVQIFAFNFPPTGWAFCNGQLMPISQNTALFALLGTIYGGDGKSTFALPDIEDSVVLGPGQGPGLSLYDQGQVAGSQFTTLLQSEMPAHSHSMLGSGSQATSSLPSPLAALSRAVGGSAYKASPFAPVVQMDPTSLSVAGGSLPHNNMMPTLTMNYCIALQGVFPQRP